MSVLQGQETKSAVVLYSSASVWIAERLMEKKKAVKDTKGQEKIK